MINTLTCVVFFKIVSFFHVVNDVHDFILIIKKEKLDRTDNHFHFKKSQINIQNYQLIWDYKDNLDELITYKSYFLFICMPTLCYQLQYPRTQKIRGAWLARKSLEMLVACGLFFYIIGQHVIPIIQETKDRYQSQNIIETIQAVR